MAAARKRAADAAESARVAAVKAAAKEKSMAKKAELAAKAEIDKAKALANHAEKWMKDRAKSDAKKDRIKF